jgi:acetyltransferase-like isoleucine patch superfamily enzyme
MGMKIGKRVELNTSNISDPALITIEDGVTIGGSVSLLAHYAMGGYLIISPVVIRKNATLGLRAIVMGGVEIGEGATILPNSVVLPKTVVPAGETWAGIPAKKLERT